MRAAHRLRGGSRADRVLAKFPNVSGTCYVESAFPGGGLANSTLSAGVSIGATSITVAGQLARNSTYVIDSETVAITTVTGTSAPYTCTLAAPLTANHSSAAAIRTDNLDHTILKPIGNGRYAFWTLEWLTKNPPYATGTVSGYGLNQLHNSGTAIAAVRTARDDASFTRVGTWTTGTSTSSFSGGYRWSSTAGNTVTWVSPSAGTTIAWEGIGDNGNYSGLVIVSIDGDKTLANFCLTAQQGVTLGIFPSTLLVANGGPAAPTDRILNIYNGSQKFNHRKLIATGLANTTHTVVLTVTGLADTRRAVGTRFSYSCLAVGGASTLLTDTNAAPFTEYPCMDSESTSSAWERADRECEPSGNLDFMGSVHGYERQTNLVLSLAGAPVTPAAGALTAIDKIVRGSTTNHKDNLANDTATCVTTYELGPRGLTVTDVKTYLRDMATTIRYIMAPHNGVASTTLPFDRVAADNAPGSATLAGTVEAQYLQSRSAARWNWNSNGKVATFFQVYNAASFTSSWANTGPGSYTQDRVGGTLAKNYAPSEIYSDGSPITVPSGTVKTRKALYSIGYFPAGADATLAAA